MKKRYWNTSFVKKRVLLPINENPTIRGFSYHATLDSICTSFLHVGETYSTFQVREEGEGNWIHHEENCTIVKNGELSNVMGSQYAKGLLFSMERELKEDDGVILTLYHMQYSNYRNNMRIGIYNGETNEIKEEFTFWVDGERNEYPVYFRLARKCEDALLCFSHDGLEWEETGKCRMDGLNKAKIQIRFEIYENQWHNWFFTNFIQLVSTPNAWNVHTEYQYNLVKGWQNTYVNMFLDYDMEDTEVIEEYCGDHVAYLKAQLNHDTYIEIDLDEYYIKGRAYYGRSHFEHPNLIYGYDDKGKHFMAMGIDLDGHLCFTNIGYKSMKKAISGCKESRRLVLIRYSPSRVEYEFKMGRMIRLVEDYLNGEDSLKDTYRRCPSKLDGSVHGIAIYRTYAENIDIFMEDKRISYIISERIDVMCKRIEFMMERGYVSSDTFEGFLKGYLELYKKSKLLVLNVVHYQMTGKDARIGEAVKLLGDMEDKEHLLLMGMLNVLN